MAKELKDGSSTNGNRDHAAGGFPGRRRILLVILRGRGRQKRGNMLAKLGAYGSLLSFSGVVFALYLDQ